MTARRHSKPTVALVGAGNLAHALGPALARTAYRVVEVVARDRKPSLTAARKFARTLGARVSTLGAPIHADLVWLCVRDDSIAVVVETLTMLDLRGRYVFHSSGALSSDALAPLREAGASVAAVHPLMTFVRGSRASFSGVWFGVEGGAKAVRLAKQVVRALEGGVLPVRADRKALYHAWASLASPMLAALLAATEEVGRAAGLSSQAAHEAILPLIAQTLANHAAFGPSGAFSGPLRRGDVATVARHLEALRDFPRAQEIYVALARSALHTLPVKEARQMARLLGDSSDKL